jgi:hypothetical protein
MPSVTVGSVCPSLGHHVARVLAERDQHGCAGAAQGVECQTLRERCLSIGGELCVGALDRLAEHPAADTPAILPCAGGGRKYVGIRGDVRARRLVCASSSLSTGRRFTYRLPASVFEWRTRSLPAARSTSRHSRSRSSGILTMRGLYTMVYRTGSRAAHVQPDSLEPYGELHVSPRVIHHPARTSRQSGGRSRWRFTRTR